MARKKILLIDDDAVVIDYRVAKLGALYELISTVSPRDALLGRVRELLGA